MEQWSSTLESVVNMNAFYHGKKVLITGHTGFKGSWLAQWLMKMGADVVGYALEPPTDPSIFKLCHLENQMQSVIGDVRDLNHLKATIIDASPEIVFHLAAQPLVRESYRLPVETFDTNCMGTVNLLEAIRQCSSVRAVVIVTTDKCYKNKEAFWGYRESDELGGFDPYSASKACAEIITESYINSFFNPADYDRHRVAVATARAGNVIGGGDFALDRLVPDGVRGLLSNESIIVRNPQSIRPWQHVLEPLAGYLKLAERLYSIGPVFNGAWNFGPDHESEMSAENILVTLCRLWNSNGNLILATENQVHETNYLKLDSYKANHLLGYKARWTIEKALEMVVEWTKSMQRNEDLLQVTRAQIEQYELVMPVHERG